MVFAGFEGVYEFSLRGAAMLYHVSMGETTVRRYNGCGDILSILSPYAGPHVSPHSCFYSITEQLSCLTNDGFKVFVLLPSLVIFVKTQKWVPLFNLPLWLSGLDTHQSQEHPGFNQVSVTYWILVLKRKSRNRRIEQERKESKI